MNADGRRQNPTSHRRGRRGGDLNPDVIKPKARDVADELRPEYNFDYSKAVRGKYYRRLLKEGSNVVVLEADVAKAFPNSDAVNDALRSLLKERLSRTSRSGKS